MSHAAIAHPMLDYGAYGAHPALSNFRFYRCLIVERKVAIYRPPDP